MKTIMTTENSLAKERERAIREHKPMRIQKCGVCGEIQLAEFFTERGRQNHICRICSRKAVERWQTGSRKRKDSVTRRYYQLKAGAEKRGINCPIELDEFRVWFRDQTKEGVCFYCQQTLAAEERGNMQGITIDRMDNTMGYEERNMVLACRRCNSIKGNWFSFEEMIEIANNYLIGRPYEEAIKNETNNTV